MVNTIAHEALQTLQTELALQAQLDIIEADLGSKDEGCVIDAIQRMHQLARNLGT